MILFFFFENIFTHLIDIPYFKNFPLIIKLMIICVNWETLFLTFILKIFIKSFKAIKNIHMDTQWWCRWTFISVTCPKTTAVQKKICRMLSYILIHFKTNTLKTSNKSTITITICLLIYFSLRLTSQVCFTTTYWNAIQDNTLCSN